MKKQIMETDKQKTLFRIWTESPKVRKYLFWAELFVFGFALCLATMFTYLLDREIGFIPLNTEAKSFAIIFFTIYALLFFVLAFTYLIKAISKMQKQSFISKKYEKI